MIDGAGTDAADGGRSSAVGGDDSGSSCIGSGTDVVCTRWSGYATRILDSSAGRWLCTGRRGTATLARRPALGLFLLVAVLAVAMALAPATSSAAPQEIGGCQDITEPGTYELNTSLSGATDDCIYIDTSDVTIDGQGHVITMSDSTAGVRSGAHQNLTIRNLRLEDGGYGTRTNGADDVTLRNVTVVGNDRGIKNNNGGTMALIDVTARNNGNSAIEPDASTEGTATRATIGDLSGNGTVADFTLEADRYKQVDAPPADPSGTESLGRYFDAEANSGNIETTIYYEPENVSDLNESRISLWQHDGNDWNRITSTVDETNDTVSGTVTGSGPVGAFAPLASFGVEVVDATDGVTEGETVSVTANLSNPTGTQDIQNVTLSTGGTVRDWQDLTIGAGNSTNVTLTWDTKTGDAGSYEATVESDEDADSASVLVQEPANFSIRNLTSNEPVVEGDSLNVTATVENLGDVTANQTVNLTVDNALNDSADLDLAGGERANVTLTWWTQGGDAADDDPYTATVTTDNDTASLDAYVLNSSNFSVSNVSGPVEPVVGGQLLPVNATIENVGSDQSEQTINLTIDGTEVANTTVELNVSERQNVTLWWDTEPADAGSHTATIASHNDNGSTAITVLEPANFSVGELWTNSSIVAGQSLTVIANVTNVGEVNGTQALNLTVNGSERANATVSLNASEHRNVTLTWTDTAGFDFDDANATVYSLDSSNSTTVTILAPANFSVGTLETNSPVTEGGNLTVTATVTNVGDVQGTRTVDLTMNGSVGTTESQSVTLAAGGSTDVVLNWTTGDDDSGTYNATVASPDSTNATTVTVQTPPDFRVNVTGTNSPVWERENLTVNATIENVGEATDQQTIELDASGSVDDSTTVSLTGGERQDLALNWTPADGTVPTGVSVDLTATVSSANDSDAAPVRVRDPEAYRVNVTGTNAPVTAGDDLAVDVRVSARNGTGNVQNLTLVVGGTERDRLNVSLTGENATNETLTWATSSGSAGTYQLNVSTADDRATTSATVESGGGGGFLPPSDGGDGGGGASASFDVSIDGTNGPVDAGETVTVAATVTNDGDAEGTEDVSLSVDGTAVGSTSVTLAAGAQTTVDLTWTTGDGDAGDHELRVSAGSDAAIRYVTVREPGPIDLAIQNTTSPIDAGRPLSVHVRVIARSSANQTVELLDADGDRADARRVSLASGESATLTLTWLTRPADAGASSVAVRSGGRLARAQVRIREPPDFRVRIDRMSSRAVVGDPQDVAVTVTSEASSRETGSLSLQVGGEERQHRRIALDAGASASYALEWTPDRADLGERRVRVQAGAGHAARNATVSEPSGGLIGLAPEWAQSSVDYRPTAQDAHVGGYLWLTGLLAAAGGYLLVSRRGLDARFLGASLLVAAVRTTTDVAHAALDAATTEPLMIANVVLELNVGLLLLGFAAAYAGEIERVRSPWTVGLAAVSVGGTAAAATNPAHGLTFTEIELAQGAFTYVSADLGPVGWLLFAVTVASQVAAAGLLVRSFLSGRDPAWRPVGVLAAGLALAVLLLGASVADRGPVPGYDYGGAAVGGFVLAATSAAVGHGLHRITRQAQASLIEDLDDPIVVCNDARDVVECNRAATDLLPGLEAGESFATAVGYAPEWPDPGSTAQTELSVAELLPTGGRGVDSGDGGQSGDAPKSGDAPRSGDAATDGAGLDADADAVERDRDAESAGRAADDDPGDDLEGEPEDDPDDGPEASNSGDQGHEGDERFYLVQTSSITADTGGTVGYTVRFTDVTTLKRRSVELASKNEQLERIASTISHDLRNPLTVATGYVEVLRDGVASGSRVEPPSLAEQLEPVADAVARMEAIIDDVIALARGREPVAADERVAFGSVVEDAWSSVETGQATLFLESEGTLTADPRRLRRILENLFRNAVDHAGPDVSVATGLTADGFHVTDDGPGIPPGERDDVFEEGYTGAVDGTGLGLAIVRQLATAHGWSVALDPEYDGGARFVFSGVDVEPATGSDGDGAHRSSDDGEREHGDGSAN